MHERVAKGSLRSRCYRDEPRKPIAKLGRQPGDLSKLADWLNPVKRARNKKPGAGLEGTANRVYAGGSALISISHILSAWSTDKIDVLHVFLE